LSFITAGDSRSTGGRLQYYSGHGQLSVASSRNTAGRHAPYMLLQQYQVKPILKRWLLYWSS